MIRVLGIGWIRGGEYGGVRRAERRTFPNGATLSTLWRAAGLLPSPPKNIGRFNAATHMACDAAALALRDAGLDAAAGQTSDIGLLASTPDGCAEANRAYFADYLAGGRRLGRGNLFIYTLPTSAAAEAAICFGLRGPLLYAAPAAAPAPALLSMAAGMLTRGEAGVMLALIAEAAAGACFVLAPAAASHQGIASVEEALRVAGAERDVAGLVGAFARRPAETAG